VSRLDWRVGQSSDREMVSRFGVRWKLGQGVLDGFDWIAAYPESAEDLGDSRANDRRLDADNQAEADRIVVKRATAAASCDAGLEILLDTPLRGKARNSEHDGIESRRHGRGRILLLEMEHTGAWLNRIVARPFALPGNASTDLACALSSMQGVSVIEAWTEVSPDCRSEHSDETRQQIQMPRDEECHGYVPDDQRDGSRDRCASQPKHADEGNTGDDVDGCAQEQQGGRTAFVSGHRHDG
jgi:hypothetical protein